MDFWSVYEGERAKPTFGSDKLNITSRDRIHLSLETVEQYGINLDMNQAAVKRYKEEERFVLATELTHDLFISIYDVNTSHSLLMRFSTALTEDVIRRVVGEVRKINKPNLEMRIIGLQNSDKELLSSAERFRSAFKSSLMEVDLFGSETRHIVFDTKLGMAFNLLLLNRIYRPGELASTMTVDQFNERKSELKFV